MDTVDVEGALSSDDISDEDIAAGLYDGATVETLLVNWRQPDDFALLRKATVGKITRTDGRFVAELESLVAFARPAERALCQPQPATPNWATRAAASISTIRILPARERSRRARRRRR